MLCFCLLMMLFLVRKCQLCHGEAIHEILKTQSGQNMRTKWTTNDFWWEYENYDYLSTLLNNVSARKTIISFLLDYYVHLILKTKMWFFSLCLCKLVLSSEIFFFQSELSKEFVLINRLKEWEKKTKKNVDKQRWRYKDDGLYDSFHLIAWKKSSSSCRFNK